MSENKNIVIQQNNRTDYDVLFPKNNSWKKEEIAIVETFQKYGLDTNAIPKDLFDYLISQIKSEYGKTYIWKRWKWTFTPEEQYANGTVYSKTVTAGYTGNLYIAQFSKVQVHRDGTYTGTINQVLTVKKYSDLPAYYYYSDIFKTKSEAQNAPPLCYSDWDSTEEADRGGIGSDGNYLYVNFVSVLSDRTTKTDESTITSSNPNAYSETDLPDAEGYFYQKDGDISAPTFGQVYNSYYMGTGTYGSSNKTVINCTGKPIFFFVKKHIWQNGASEEPNLYSGMRVNLSDFFYSATNNYNSRNYLYWDNNSVSWYCTNNKALQLNENNTRYDFIVIQTI